MSQRDNFRFQIMTRYLSGSLDRVESARLLQVSPRTVTRLSHRIQKNGIFGVQHGNLGRPPLRKYPEEIREYIIDLLCKKYFDFNVKHFHEILVKEYQIDIPYKTIWLWCKELSLVKNPRIKRRRKREFRHRMPSEGLLLQMDGCHHKFNAKDEWCLIAAIDDATSEIPYAEFFDGETTQACLKVLKHIIELKGLPKAIYTDRAGWAGGGKRVNFSQFKRACDELGIQVIFANSPEGKGRIERSFRTIQDRLIPELRINKITEIKKANNYLQMKFLKNYWKKEKVVVAANPIPAYSPLEPFLDLESILSVVEIRKIASDSTTSWQGQKFKVVGPIGYGSYEAKFKTDFNGHTRIFVRDQEVQLEVINEPTRLQIEEKVNVPMGLSFQHYVLMARTIRELRNEVVQH